MAEGSYLDAYQPFNDSSSPQPAPVISASPMSELEDLPTSHKGQKITEEQIREYEERLQLLEHNIEKQEHALEQQRLDLNNEPPPNWPKCYPVLYFNINDVPQNQQHFIKRAFHSWIFLIISLMFNWIGCLCLLTTDKTFKSPGSKIALSSIYFFLISPLAFDLDNLSIFRALSKGGSSFAFFKIFICLILTLIFEIILFFGYESSGSIGIIATIQLFFNKYYRVGIVGIITSLLFALSFIFHITLTLKLWNFYKGTSQGADMETDVKHGVTEFLMDKLV